MLALRSIDKNDYAVIDDGNTIGRIRHAAERTNDIWMWNVTIPIPDGVPYGNAGDLEPAKVAFREAWLKFEAAAGPNSWRRRARPRTKRAPRGKA